MAACLENTGKNVAPIVRNAMQNAKTALHPYIPADEHSNPYGIELGHIKEHGITESDVEKLLLCPSPFSINEIRDGLLRVSCNDTYKCWDIRGIYTKDSPELICIRLGNGWTYSCPLSAQPERETMSRPIIRSRI